MQQPAVQVPHCQQREIVSPDGWPFTQSRMWTSRSVWTRDRRKVFQSPETSIPSISSFSVRSTVTSDFSTIGMHESPPDSEEHRREGEGTGQQAFDAATLEAAFGGRLEASRIAEREQDVHRCERRGGKTHRPEQEADLPEARLRAGVGRGRRASVGREYAGTPGRVPDPASEERHAVRRGRMEELAGEVEPYVRRRPRKALGDRRKVRGAEAGFPGLPEDLADDRRRVLGADLGPVGARRDDSSDDASESAGEPVGRDALEGADLAELRIDRGLELVDNLDAAGQYTVPELLGHKIRVGPGGAPGRGPVTLEHTGTLVARRPCLRSPRRGSPSARWRRRQSRLRGPPNRRGSCPRAAE